MKRDYIGALVAEGKDWILGAKSPLTPPPVDLMGRLIDAVTRLAELRDEERATLRGKIVEQRRALRGLERAAQRWRLLAEGKAAQKAVDDLHATRRDLRSRIVELTAQNDALRVQIDALLFPPKP